MNDRADPFDEAALLAHARRKVGLDDFGDEGFRAPLRVLLDAYRDAPLNAVGQMVLRSSLGRSLQQRLRAIDWETRHPEIADERIERPIIVVGMMRSGTTLVQRLLAQDPRLYSALGWEIGEPAPRPGTRWDEVDPRIADGVARAKQMRDFAPALYAIHPTDALEADEEIVFLADAFLSHVPEASCDVPRYRAWLDTQDFAPAYRYLRRMLQLLQWQKRMRGDVRDRWVLKTPAHLGYLDTLLDTFPDAHVIHMHRSPLDTIPSGASLNATLWKMYSDEVDEHVVGRQWLERMAWTTGRAMTVRAALAATPGRFSDVWYRHAVSAPMRVIEALYADLDLALTAQARRAMTVWLEGQARSKADLPVHRYTAEQFGLSGASIAAAFEDYIERFVRPHEDA